VNIVLLVPTGFAARNVLLGTLARRLARQGTVRVLHGMPASVVDGYREENPNVEWHTVPSYRETPAAATLRYALGYAHMYWGGTRSMRFMLNLPVQGSWRTHASRRLARGTGRLCAHRPGIRLLDRCHQATVARLPIVRHYVALFERWQPDVVFCADQRPADILPAVLAARLCGITTVTFVASWDNLTSKARIAAPFDHYLVWSALMRDELLQFYPDVSSSQIHIVGGPQFEPYTDSRRLWPRRTFFERLGADPSRPLICFSGGDVAASPEDAEHVRALMELIRDGRIAGRPQVVLRPSPSDGSGRFDAVRRDFPELLFSAPAWVQSDPKAWTQIWPLALDVDLLSNLTWHCDVNVNFGSTMTLDFALREKPVVNVAFDVSTPPVFGAPFLEVNYQFEHYQPIIALGAARIAQSRDELARHVNAYLADPTLDADARRRLVELQLRQPISQATDRTLAALTSIGRREPAASHAHLLPV
jgi:hypothetical protein